MKNFKYFTFFCFLFFLVLNNCGIYKKVDSSVPIQGEERAKKNVAEGKGMSIKGLTQGRSTNYEFSSSNPMWRASLDTLEFLPLATVDYSGGLIITDWYNSNPGEDPLKITIRFLSNEIASSNLKIIIHKKTCINLTNCKITELKSSQIKNQLLKSILEKASKLEIASKNKK